ncbi:cell surface protein, partial [Streptococcus uberis]|nr:cell surface protein [Streptococcus uberis]
SDPTGVIGYITTKGKLNYSSVYDPTLNKANITIDSITLDTWQLDLNRPSISGNTNAFAEYIGLDGTSLFKQAYTGLTSMSPITIGKTSQIGKTFTVASGETTPEFMFLKTNPFWEFFAPSSLFAKLTYNTAPLPNKPVEPTLVTFTPEALKPVPQTPPTPVYVTPTLKTFALEVYTPIKPTVKPHVVVPEKLNVTVSVH